MMIIVLVRILVDLACMVGAITVAPVLYLMGNSAGALTALLICYGVSRMVAVKPEDRSAFESFLKQRYEKIP